MASTTWAQISSVASRAAYQYWCTSTDWYKCMSLPVYWYRLVHVTTGIPVQTGISACHYQCTSTYWYQCMSLPVHQYRLVHMHVTTSISVETGTSACHYWYTSTDWNKFFSVWYISKDWFIFFTVWHNGKYKCMSLLVYLYRPVQGFHSTEYQ